MHPVRHALAVPTELRQAFGYDHWLLQPIRYADQDSARHVNNVAYARHAETARMHFLAERTGPLPWPLEDLRAQDIALDYLAEARFPGSLATGTRVLAVTDAEFRLGQGLFLSGRCLCALVVDLAFGPPGARRTLPPAFRERFAALRRMPAC
ncbi:MAG: acyl-CoA thioesterase [Alphaproteobacteria bacterium]|nr:acyl-CoA thioesterase [Alphaproteobacteria bacterium]